MCLVGLAWGVHAQYPLVLAGNRDEFHARPAAPADWWTSSPEVFGGRDLAAGGSWLACSRTGRIAVVINDPRRPRAAGHTASRGELVRDFVAGADAPDAFLDALAAREHHYAGFQLLVGTVREGFMRLRSPAGVPGTGRRVPASVAVYGNSPPEAPWPKVIFLEAALRELLKRPALDPAVLLEPLAHRAAAAGSSGDAAIRASPFVAGSDYGTRASTILLADAQGSLRFFERRFAPDGSVAGESAVTFQLSA